MLIYKNLIRLDEERNAHIALAMSVVFTFGLIVIFINIPDEVYNNLVSQLGSIITGLAVWFLYKQTVSEQVSDVLEKDGHRASNWHVAGFTLLGIVIYLTLTMLIALSEPTFPGQKVTFDTNEIYHDENVSAMAVQQLADKLFEVQYFGEINPETAARLELTEDGYIITLIIHQDVWEDPDVISELQSMKWFLEVDFQRPATIKLEHYDLSGETKTKSI